MIVLGVHIGHDSSVSLVVDGKLVADVAEERFVRIKHYSGLPINSIEYCLQQGGCSIHDIDAVAIPSRLGVQELNYLFDLDDARKERGTGKGRMLEWAKRLNRSMLSAPPLYLKRFPIRKKTRLVHVEHHLAHAASAYYTSGIKERCLVVTIDGLGDGHSVCLWRAENGEISPLAKIGSTGSIGWFYSNVTEALGWWHGDGEGKTMGLAPYGSCMEVRGKLDPFCPKYAGGQLVEEHNFGTPYFWNEGGAFQWHFEDSYRIRDLVEQYGREDISAEAQRLLEEQAANIIFPWLEKEGTTHLACAGGVFLNVKLNQRIWYSGKVASHWVYPNPGDAGLSAGAALYVYYSSNPNAEHQKLQDLYLGPEYTGQDVEGILKLRGIRYTTHERPEEIAAEKLHEGKIVGWFQGRMESGPRALGSRSIIMSADRAENKDIINARVKFREPFRPFCPSLLNEKKDVYLIRHRDEPFMITSFDVVPEKREKIPAVVHKDNTARPQTVTQSANPRYYRLIQAFGHLSGEYAILNTSFNIKGEPIVCHPREALRCFFDSGMDVLVVENAVVEK